MTFTKVLVANRGEIAVRLIQGIQQAGLQAVAVHSEPDKHAPHVALADDVISLKGQTSAETYLDTATLLAECKRLGVDAIHPGYGFLSENAEFARACKKAGLTFIGPSPEVIDSMGDKITAKKLMDDAGVPILPSIEITDDTPEKAIEAEAEKIGYPVLVKAAAGGGGKGMRRVDSPADLLASMAAAQREATNAFGDGRVFIEKYVVSPRHVEIQIFGDTHGNAIHLWERECSIQRRHQKIIEESPSPALDDALREKMATAAVTAAKALNYTNAGTVEFILAPNGEFYFLEVNTRLQVEHPVTELVTGLDLVALQLLVAKGEALPSQSAITQRGHAVECRIYAEDPANNFLPSIGTLHRCQWPIGPNVRVDTGIVEGNAVSIHYDPMLAKLICWGPNRAAALATMDWALQNTVILGVTTNIGFLRQVINHPQFISGEFDTHFLEHHPITEPALSDEELALAAIISRWPATAALSKSTTSTTAPNTAPTESPWALANNWRNAGLGV